VNKNLELARAIIVLPGTALVLIPGLILYNTEPLFFLFGLKFPAALWPLGIGLVFAVSGLLAAFKTVSLFMTVGDGTPAPWAPPKNFVVEGPYRYVRNPMLLSVLAVLLAEACFLGSIPILVWCLVFWLINTLYFIYVEEPGLVKRFGADYVEYKKHVRRWLPRLKPWKRGHLC